MSLPTLVLLLISSFASAAVNPTEPGPGEIYRAGSQCTVAWDVDKTGQWNNVTLTLMSGSNVKMVKVIPVLRGLDCTDSDLSPFQWTCPDVSSYSASYFYSFVNGDDDHHAEYTTRFTIASPTGQTISPQFSTQSDGSKVPWSNAHLVAATAVEDPRSRAMLLEAGTNPSKGCQTTNCFIEARPAAENTTAGNSSSNNSTLTPPSQAAPRSTPARLSLPMYALNPNMMTTPTNHGFKLNVGGLGLYPVLALVMFLLS